MISHKDASTKRVSQQEQVIIFGNGLKDFLCIANAGVYMYAQVKA